MANGQNSFYDIWNFNPYNLDTNTDYSGIMSNFSTLQRGVASGISMNDQLRNSMNNLQNQLLPVAQWYGVTPDKLTPQQVAQYQNYIDQNTGFKGWANNTFGGVNNMLSFGKGAFDILMGLQQLNLAKDYRDMYAQNMAFNQNLGAKNYKAMAQSYNSAKDDQIRSRRFTETGSTAGWEEEAAKHHVDETL